MTKSWFNVNFRHSHNLGCFGILDLRWVTFIDLGGPIIQTWLSWESKITLHAKNHTISHKFEISSLLLGLSLSQFYPNEYDFLHWTDHCELYTHLCFCLVIVPSITILSQKNLKTGFVPKSSVPEDFRTHLFILAKINPEHKKSMKFDHFSILGFSMT